MIFGSSADLSKALDALALFGVPFVGLKIIPSPLLFRYSFLFSLSLSLFLASHARKREIFAKHAQACTMRLVSGL